MAFVALQFRTSPVAGLQAGSAISDGWQRYPSPMPRSLRSRVISLGGALWAVLHPERGLQDRIAGTWLVPR